MSAPAGFDLAGRLALVTGAGSGLGLAIARGLAAAGARVVLTPHVGSATWQTRQAMADLAFGNLTAHFAGKPLLSPVP